MTIGYNPTATARRGELGVNPAGAPNARQRRSDVDLQIQQQIESLPGAGTAVPLQTLHGARDRRVQCHHVAPLLVHVTPKQMRVEHSAV